MRRLFHLIFLLAVAVPARAGELPQPTAPYREDDYLLAYDTFIQAGALKDALAVALKAVENAPADLEWHRRVALAARWQGKSRLALAHYYAAARLGDPQALGETEELARILHDPEKLVYVYRSKLRQYPHQPGLLLRLARAYGVAGEPEKAIDVLQDCGLRRKTPACLAELAHVYRYLDRPGEERKALALLLQRVPGDARGLLRLALIEYVHGRIGAAYGLISRHESDLQTWPEDLLQLYLELAWLQQDYANFRRLVLLHPQVSAMQIARMVDLGLEERHIEEAFQMAMRLWQRQPDVHSAMLLLSVAGEDESGRLLDKVMAQLQLHPLPELSNYPLYYFSLIRWHRRHGRRQQVQTLLAEAMRRWPDNQELWLDYFWLVMSSGHYQRLRPWLPALRHKASRQPGLVEPLVALLTALDRPEEALLYARRVVAKHQTDPLWLLGYTDLLDQAERPQEAMLWRVYTRQLLAEGRAFRNGDQRFALLRLLQRFGQGDRNAAEMLRLLTDTHTSDNERRRDLVLAWSFAENSNELERFWYLKAYWQRHSRPPWADLTQALQETDGDTIVHLLDGDLERLPRRDMVSAARLWHLEPWAASHAFERLDQVPRDWRLLNQFKESALLQAGAAGVGLRSDNLQGGGHWERLLLDLQGQVSPRLRMRALMDQVAAIDLDPQVWRRGEPKPASYLLQLDFRHRFGVTRFQGGVLEANGQHLALGLEHQWPFSSHLNLGFKVASGERNQESVQLFLAGSAREVSGRFAYSLNERHQWYGRVGQRWFVDAQEHDLGRGVFLDAGYRWLWRARAPQLAIRSEVMWHQFSDSGRLPQRLVRHVPAGNAADATFIIPQDYTQLTLALDFDTDVEFSWTPRFSPFVSVAATWHSVNRFGGSIRGGLATQLLGPDHLQLYAERVEGGQGVLTDSWGAGLQYRLFF